MSTVIQTIRLRSAQRFGRKLPPGPLGKVLYVLPSAVRRSVLMAVEGRSVPRRPYPAWLTAATDVRLVDYGGEDETILFFEAPRIGDAAPVLYEQKPCRSPLPEPEDTGLDLLADVLADLWTGNPNSDRFDRPLLRDLIRFRPAVGKTFEAIEVQGRRYSAENPARLDIRVLETAERFRAGTPASQRARVVGTLDMVRASTRSFAIRLEDGQELRGVLLVGQISDIAPLLEKQVLVLGRVQYKPSGRVLRIDADTLMPATGDMSVWSRIPPARGQPVEIARLRQAQGPRSGLPAIIGRWPGDESDEEIEAWLKEIS